MIRLLKKIFTKLNFHTSIPPSIRLLKKFFTKLNFHTSIPPSIRLLKKIFTKFNFHTSIPPSIRLLKKFFTKLNFHTSIGTLVWIFLIFCFLDGASASFGVKCPFIHYWGRVTKKLSQEFCRTKSRILDVLSKLDQIFLNPQVRTCSVAVQRTFRNNNSENWEPSGNRSLDDTCPEVVFSACHTSNLNDSEQEETHHRFLLQNYFSKSKEC